MTSFALAFSPLAPEQKHGSELKLIDALLSNHHYLSKRLSDEMSSEVLDLFISRLDSGKYVFTKSDLLKFEPYRSTLDERAKIGNLDPAYEIYNLYSQKMLKRIDWIEARLEKPLSKTRTDSIAFEDEDITRATSEDELNERWEKRLTHEWLNLVLANKDEEKARETIKKRYKNIAKRIERSKPEEVFELFMNALTGVYDPHTTYFSPRSAESFNMNMSLSLEGIGATLFIEDELVTIKNLIVGGPAKKSGQLRSGDQIIAVAQNKDGEFVDVVGWRLDEVVQLIRGKRGTVVRLMIQQALNGEMREISITRDKIKLEEQAAKSEIKEIAGKKIGIIDLPSFYQDFRGARENEDDYRSTTRDVSRILNKLKAQNIDGLIIDLRNNGGGSLPEAIDMTGLFIDEGPVVQVKEAGEKKDVYSDDNEGVLYDGPMAVMINGHSASASEIFAGAIKDYGRGVILGEPSFGKGTVQSILRLARFLPGIDDKTGDLKLTRSMFYRINGSSTQLRGVKPDIYLPKRSVVDSKGESEELHALPWQEISAADYQFVNRVMPFLDSLKSSYEKYQEKTPAIDLLVEQMAFFNKGRSDTKRSLNYEARKQRRENDRAYTLELRNKLRKEYGFDAITVDSLDKKERDKTDADKAREKSEKIDVELDAAVFLVAELATLEKGKALD